MCVLTCCMCKNLRSFYPATELQVNLRRGLIYKGPLSAQRYLHILSLFVIIFYFICLTTPIGVWNQSLEQNSLISLLWATFRPFPHKYTMCWSIFSPPHPPLLTLFTALSPPVSSLCCPGRLHFYLQISVHL